MYTSVTIIDDYPINLRIAEMLIRKNGFFDNVTSYSDAELALYYLTINQKEASLLPDIILLDIQMPGMNGWQFLDRFEEIRKGLKKHIHIFILSSSLNDRDIQRSEEYSSVSRFLSKPLTQGMLNDMLEVVKLDSVS